MRTFMKCFIPNVSTECKNDDINNNSDKYVTMSIDDAFLVDVFDRFFTKHCVVEKGAYVPFIELYTAFLCYASVHETEFMEYKKNDRNFYVCTEHEILGVISRASPCNKYGVMSGIVKYPVVKDVRITSWGS